MAYHSSIQQADRTYHIKLAIRAFNAVAALVGIGLVAYIVNYWDSHFGVIDGFTFNGRHMLKSQAWTLMSFIPLGLTVLAFGLSAMYCLLRKKSIHPGWTTGYDLVATAAFVAFTYMTFYDAYRLWCPSHYRCVKEPEEHAVFSWRPGHPYSYNVTDNAHPLSRDVATGYYTVDLKVLCKDRFRRSTLAAAILTMSLIFPHFFLFVWGIFDTSHRRHQVVSKRMADEMITEMETGGRREAREESVI